MLSVRHGEHAHGQIDAAYANALMERRNDAGRFDSPPDGAVGVHAETAEREYFRHGDDVPLHAADFLDSVDAAVTIVAALHLNDDIDRGRDLRPHGADGK